MSNMKKGEIVSAGNSALANSEVPEWLRSEVGNQKGMEDVDQSDIVLPRLGLCQALSPQKRKSDKAYIENLQEGELFNSVTQEIYGTSLEIIPLFFFKNRIKYFPIEDGGGIECMSANGIDGGSLNPMGCASCRFSAWGNGSTKEEDMSNPPLCTYYHNLMCFTLTDNPMPIAMSYKATGLKLSKQFLANVRLSRLPMYAKKYKISVVTVRDGSNEWFEKKLVPSGFPDESLYRQMEEHFKALREMNIKVDTTGEAADVDFPTDDERVPAGHTEL